MIEGRKRANQKLSDIVCFLVMVVGMLSDETILEIQKMRERCDRARDDEAELRETTSRGIEENLHFDGRTE